MKPSPSVVRILLAWVALLVFRVIAGVVIPIKVPFAPHALAWMMGTDLLTVAVLGLMAMQSKWSGLRLGLAVFIIPFGITAANLLEGYVFLTGSGINWPRVLAYMFLTYALAAPVWMLIFGSRAEQGEQRIALPQSLGARLWRFAVSDLAYFIFYFTAGMIIFPFVKDFYATQTIPPFGKLAGLQLGIRGPVFVAICLLFLRMVRLPRAAGMLAVGAAFAILNGVVQLLPPSPYFPDAVRWVHFCEVVSSNFVFGAFVAWLWGGTRTFEALQEQAA